MTVKDSSKISSLYIYICIHYTIQFRLTDSLPSTSIIFSYTTHFPVVKLTLRTRALVHENDDFP